MGKRVHTALLVRANFSAVGRNKMVRFDRKRMLADVDLKSSRVVAHIAFGTFIIMLMMFGGMIFFLMR